MTKCFGDLLTRCRGLGIKAGFGCLGFEASKGAELLKVVNGHRSQGFGLVGKAGLGCSKVSSIGGAKRFLGGAVGLGVGSLGIQCCVGSCYRLQGISQQIFVLLIVVCDLSGRSQLRIPLLRMFRCCRVCRMIPRV